MILYYKYNTFPANRQPSITNLPSLSPPSPAPSPIADNSVPVSGCGNIGVHFARAHAPSPGNGRTPSGGRWRRHGLVIPAADCRMAWTQLRQCVAADTQEHGSVSHGGQTPTIQDEVYLEGRHTNPRVQIRALRFDHYVSRGKSLHGETLKP